jgi:hypothetical protein
VRYFRLNINIFICFGLILCTDRKRVSLDRLGIVLFVFDDFYEGIMKILPLTT